ncbi:hypothetical protein JCM10212_003325 [Sporobolomyces blumeae]
MSTSRAVASASNALTNAVKPSARPRRVSKRTQQSSRSASLSNLISLYHLSPTFVPTAAPSRLQDHVNQVLAPKSHSTSKPRPHDLLALVLANYSLDQERIKLDLAAASPSAASLLGVKLRLGENSRDSYVGLDSTFGRDREGAIYDHEHSFYSAHTNGAEPPLAKRVRRIVDRLHGTEAGGRAGLEVVEEHGAKAVEWQEGLRDARRQERDREARDEEEAEAFGDMFVEDKASQH